jgi:protein gp37
MNPWKWSVLNATHVENETALLLPLRKRKPTFIANIGDLFHKGVPFEFIDKVFAVMAICPQHTFQILTKRPERMAEYLTSERENHKRIGYSANEGIARPINWPLKNVWLGTSCENQETADERIPHLLECPAAVRFLSCEPLLGEIDLYDSLDSDRDNPCKCGDGECSDCWSSPAAPTVHWVIVGGESGPNARPCNLDWIRSIVLDCKATGVPVFVKQLGSLYRDHHNIDAFPEDLRVREWPR